MDNMWVEKYRPKTLAEVAGQPVTIGSLRRLLEPDSLPEMPHLLFSGSPGVGKTTTALCIARQILKDHRTANTLELNASDERGLEMVREKVKTFSRYAAIDAVPFKIIILDEADEMTSAAQTALRRIIEDAAESCRFILIVNNISKIIGPIQSRCAVFNFTTVPKADVISRLRYIADYENVTIEIGALDAVYEYSQGDMRRAIMLMQTAIKDDTLSSESIKAAAGKTNIAEVERILNLALAGKFTEARTKTVTLTRVYGMTESDFLKYLVSAIFRQIRIDPSKAATVVAKYDYRIISGANSEIQLSALLAELGTLK